MPSKERPHRKETSNSERRTPSSVVENRRAPLAAQTGSATVHQLAGLDAGSLTPRDVLQLQRAVGNRAVGRLFAGRKRPGATSPVIQLKVASADEPAVSRHAVEAGADIAAPELERVVNEAIEKCNSVAEAWEFIDAQFAALRRKTAKLPAQKLEARVKELVAAEEYSEALNLICDTYHLKDHLDVIVTNTDDYLKHTDSKPDGDPYGLTVPGMDEEDAEDADDQKVHVYIHNKWIKAWVEHGLIGNLVSTLRHELRHAFQYTNDSFQGYAPIAKRDAREFEAYAVEIVSAYYKTLLGGQGSLPSKRHIEESFTAATKHYDDLTLHGQTHFAGLRARMHAVYPDLLAKLSNRKSFGLYESLFLDLYREVLNMYAASIEDGRMSGRDMVDRARSLPDLMEAHRQKMSPLIQSRHAGKIEEAGSKVQIILDVSKLSSVPKKYQKAAPPSSSASSASAGAAPKPPGLSLNFEAFAKIAAAKQEKEPAAPKKEVAPTSASTAAPMPTVAPTTTTAHIAAAAATTTPAPVIDEEDWGDFQRADASGVGTSSSTPASSH